MRLLIHALIFICLSQLVLPGVPVGERQFRGVNGTTISANLLDLRDEQALLGMDDGRELWIPFDRLTEEDRTELQALSEDPYFSPANGTPTPANLNRLLGLPLFADRNLWDESAAAVAQRLEWPRESKTEFSESFRRYPGSDVRIAGARPHSTVLYGRAGRVEYVSMVFANKGDGAARRPESNPRQAQREIQNEIRADGQAISETLSALGDPERQAFGQSGAMREHLLRWDWEGHSFLLAIQDGEYTALRIVPTAMADARGRADRSLQSHVARHLQEQVRNRENDDVIIANIPMVNQGPKGYCVPATFERYLRYMGIPADMYVLAMAGNTGIGGGTRVGELMDGIRGWVNAHGRRMNRAGITLRVNDVARYIDAGQPILWVMHSTSEFNRMAGRVTAERARFDSAREWERRLRDLRRDAGRISREETNPHVCLIVGYNRRTGEVAVSDSWGSQYEERWIHADDAAEVCRNFFFVIDP